MDILLTAILALILAPGLGYLTMRVAGHPATFLPPPGRFSLNADMLAALASLLLATLALALLPWPLHPSGSSSWVGRAIVLWATVEGAFLIPLLVSQLTAAPRIARAALREAQITGAGRLALWVAAGGLLWSGAGWTLGELPGRILLLIAGIMAVAAAAGVGPFAPDTGLSTAGTEEGLDAVSRWWAHLARFTRSGLALALLVVAALPGPDVVQPVFGLILAIGLFMVALVVLRQITRTQPHLTLHMTVQWCLWRALPLALAGSIYLAWFA